MKPISPKQIILIFSLLLLSCTTLHAQTETFEWQGVMRQYNMHIPAQHADCMPVMFFLHGLGDNLTHLEQEFNFTQLADDFGWAIVLPQALNLGIGNMWNVPGIGSGNVDDEGFIMTLLDTLTVRHNLNPDSVFFTGFSMGGFMTHMLAIKQGNRITACAPVSGLITTPLASLTPVAPVRMLHIHGTNDNVVGYNGSSIVFGSKLGLSVDEIINYWQNANGCSGEPQIDSLPDTHNDGLRFVRYSYNCYTDLQLLKVIGGTHTWYFNGHDVSYLQIIHDFFTGDNFLSIFEDHDRVPIRITPNPTDGVISVESEHSTEVTLFDMHGRMILQRHLDAGVSQLDLRHLPSGIYTLRTQIGETMKVIIN